MLVHVEAPSHSLSELLSTKMCVTHEVPELPLNAAIMPAQVAEEIVHPVLYVPVEATIS